MSNKKVLLRERKRHTARRVVSTPSVLAGGYLTGYPRGGYLTGYPPGGYLTGYPPRGEGYLTGYPPRGGGVPDWVPPWGGTRSGTSPAAPWHSGKCCKALWDMGTPPRCGQTNKVKLLPSRRTTYAGGNDTVKFYNTNTMPATCYLVGHI